MYYNKVEICGVNTSDLKVLTDEEKHDLLLRTHNGDEEARQELISGNLRLVLSIIQRFTNALQKGMKYVDTHTAKEIAKVIAPQFKETDLETIEKIVTRYYDQETWKDNLIFEESSFDLLQSILLDAGELTEVVPYDKVVDNQYAKEAE